MNNVTITLSRFMYAPHTLGELALAIFGWMLLASVPAMLWILIEFLFTPNYRRLEKDFRYTWVFEACTVYVVIFALIFVVYCVLPTYIPVVHVFFKSLDAVHI